MNPKDWKRAQELFDELVDVAADEREARLASEPDGVRELVHGMLSHDPGPEAGGSSPDESPTRIGAYEVVRSIERGGMGEVLLARRADGEFDKAVAIKLLLPGLQGEELLERFSRERQVLATLDHPHIARLLDAGTVPGERRWRRPAPTSG